MLVAGMVSITPTISINEKEIKLNLIKLSGHRGQISHPNMTKNNLQNELK
jgi:hypothetical protein